MSKASWRDVTLFANCIWSSVLISLKVEAFELEAFELEQGRYKKLLVLGYFRYILMTFRTFGAVLKLD